MSVVPPSRPPCEVCGNPWPEGAKICSACKLPRHPVQCGTCGKWIPKARYCNECKTYRFWLRRWFTGPPVTLALVTSLISVFASGFTAWSWYVYHESHTSVTLLAANNTDTVSLYVWNTGRSPSIVLSCWLHYANSNHGVPLELKSGTPTISAAGQSIMEYVIPVPDVRPDDQGHLTVKVQESNGARPERRVDMTKDFMKALQDRYASAHREGP